MNAFKKLTLSVLMACAAGQVFAQARTMGPMPVAPQAESAKAAPAPATMWLAREMAASHSIQALHTEVSKKATTTDVTSDHSKRQVIGAARTLTPGQQRVELAQLTWHAQADGTKVARVRINVEGATSARVGYRLEGGLSPSALRLSGPQHDVIEAGRAPYDGNTLVWSDIFDGDHVLIDVRLGAGETAQGRALVIEHAVGLDVRSNLTRDEAKREQDIGTSQSCEIDLACVNNPSQALRDIARSVAKIVFQGLDGRTYLCSATLIANTQAKPYMLTANHCLSDQREANTVVSFWQFEAGSCGSRAIPSFQRITDGVRLTYADARSDVALAEMYSSPPSNALLAGWSADPGRRGTSVMTLHHPNGDLKKYTSGQAVGYVNVRSALGDDNSNVRLPGDETTSYFSTLWSQGSTEGGSSGGGLFTLEPSNTGVCTGGCYLLRGALAQGSASCTNPSGTDKYSRFDLAFSYIASFLSPSQVPVAMDGSIATEYYNTTNDHYFLTADPAEAASLDSAATRLSGWFRTGEQMGVWRAGTAGRAPVCRFFGDLPIGGPNSHFYTADAGECGQVAAPNSGWKRESADAFRVSNPVGNSCPSGTQPLYRVYNYHNTPTYRNTLTGRNGYDSNHRYITRASYFDLMLEKDSWGLEPVGRVPVMCVR
jgi:lysyl endopeptidase